MWGLQTTSKTLICNLSQNSLHYVEIKILTEKKKNKKQKTTFMLQVKKRTI